MNHLGHAIVVTENIHAISALAGRLDEAASIEATNRSPGVTTTSFLHATTVPINHDVDGGVERPALAAVRARHAEFAAVGLNGTEEPTDEGSADDRNIHTSSCDTVTNSDRGYAVCFRELPVEMLLPQGVIVAERWQRVEPVTRCRTGIRRGLATICRTTLQDRASCP